MSFAIVDFITEGDVLKDQVGVFVKFPLPYILPFYFISSSKFLIWIIIPLVLNLES